MNDHTSTHRGWVIEIIAAAERDMACWMTAPDGKQHHALYPLNYGVNGALSCARARINRLIDNEAAMAEGVTR